ncbi:MAG TPA: cupredoxin family copper-binding protein [Acidimicrobiia bacterium]|nr:cupredoxin family copper-binding protein [Acidimicrobiia bacterium]
MKRVLIAASLGGLLLVGTPTLASSAQRNDTRAEKNADNNGGDNKGGNRNNHSHNNRDRGRDHRADRGDRDRNRHHGDRGRDRHHRHGYYRDGWYGGGSWYGEPQDCWYGPSGAYNCEPYGGDYYGGGYHPGYSGYHGTQNRNVYVERHAFNPAEVHTGVGQEVLWVFRDSDPHTVTADNRSFDSGEIRQGEFRLVFEQPGSYSYHCALHPDMKGRVVVHG